MALVFADLVQETSLSPGTGTLLLLGATNYMRAFSAVPLATGDTCWVRITEAGTNNWEESLATYNLGAITRSFAAGSKSSTGALVNFGTGLKTISLIAPRNNLVLMDNSGDAAVTRYLTATSIGIGATVANLTTVDLRISAPITGGTIAYGALVDSTVQSDVTSQAYGYSTALKTLAATFSVGVFAHYNAVQGVFGAGSTVTNQYGFKVDATLVGATSNYGFHSSIPSGTNRWNFYAVGTAWNYFAGNTGIGTTALTQYSLRVAAPIAGASIAYGVSVDSAVATSVNNGAYGYYSGVTTAASAAVASIVHFGVLPAAKGSGSTIVTQYGFHVNSAMTTGTSNYAFSSALAASASVWNLYMSGTAQNYLAGNLGIGAAASTPTALLDIAGDEMRLRTAKTPASAAAAGNVGAQCWDTDYMYVCVAANTWKRAALATW